MTDENSLFVNVAEEESKLFEFNTDKKRLGIPEQTNSSGTYQNPDIGNGTQQTNYQNISVVSPNTQPVVSAQNVPQLGYYQPMPQNFGMQPMLPPVVFTSEEEQEAQDEVSFFEKNYEIYVYVTKRAGAEKQKFYRPAEINAKTKTKEYCIARFLISSVQKVITEEFEQDAVSYQVNCKYFSYKKGKEQNIAVSVPEEILHSNKLTALFRKAFSSDHIPFVSEMDKRRSDYLSDYIIQQYQKNPEAKEAFIQPDTEDISELSDMDKKDIVKGFYHAVYHNASSEMKILLLAGFGAVFMDELEDLSLFSGTPRVSKTIIVYNCQSSETQRYITALASVWYDDNQLKKLSQIQVTAQKDELQVLFFEKQYQVLFFEDDQRSSYSERQNIAKIQHITEYVSTGISREENYTISCTAVIFTRRKLTEFRNFADDCIFLDAENVNLEIYSPDSICWIVTRFLALLYQNRDYFFKNNAEKIRKVLFDYSGMKSIQQNIIHIYKIYQYIINNIFCSYGIPVEETSEDDEFYTLILENQPLDETQIVSRFVAQLNDFMEEKRISVKAYDKSLLVFHQDALTEKKALLYEHNDEELLLFSNDDFESLFSSPAVDMKTLREILSSHHCMTINYSEKSCFRMPIDERKLYAAVKVSCLKKEFRAELPEVHPVFIPDLNDGTKRILLGNNEHGSPLYWALSRQENKSVLIQGNTRMGKTYFTTIRLIKGLHENGCDVIVFESAAPSYSMYELKKCGFDDNFIAENFCHGKARNAREIIKEFAANKGKVYITDHTISNNVKKELCGLIFGYQDYFFNKNPEKIHPLFVVFEEAGDSSSDSLYDTEEVKRIYNQGSKLKLSVITILQMFIGKGSQNFRRMAGQASLKVSFNCSETHIKYFTDSIPQKKRTMMKNKLALLNVGEAVVCGNFETPDGTLKPDCFLIKGVLQ